MQFFIFLAFFSSENNWGELVTVEEEVHLLLWLPCQAVTNVWIFLFLLPVGGDDPIFDQNQSLFCVSDTVESP